MSESIYGTLTDRTTYYHEHSGKTIGKKIELARVQVPLRNALVLLKPTHEQIVQQNATVDRLVSGLSAAHITMEQVSDMVARMAREETDQTQSLSGGFSLDQVRLGISVVNEDPLKPETSATLYIGDPEIIAHEEIYEQGLPDESGITKVNSSFMFNLQAPTGEIYSGFIFNKVSTGRNGQVLLSPDMFFLIQEFTKRGIISFTADGTPFSIG